MSVKIIFINRIGTSKVVDEEYMGTCVNFFNEKSLVKIEDFDDLTHARITYVKVGEVAGLQCLYHIYEEEL